MALGFTYSHDCHVSTQDIRELTYSTWSITRWYHVSTELHENPITLAEVFSVARCTIPQAHPTKENKLKIITKYWRHRKHNFLYEVMNADICDTCEDKRNLCTEFEPENIVITSVTNSSVGCDCLHRAQFLTFYRLEMVPAFISGRHVRVTPKRTREWVRRETLPKRSWILKSMESEIGRHKVLRNASIWRQSRCAKIMGIHNWENRQNTYQSALLHVQICRQKLGRLTPLSGSRSPLHVALYVYFNDAKLGNDTNVIKMFFLNTTTDDRSA